jgi:hypothetical protein
MCSCAHGTGEGAMGSMEQRRTVRAKRGTRGAQEGGAGQLRSCRGMRTRCEPWGAASHTRTRCEPWGSGEGGYGGQAISHPPQGRVHPPQVTVPLHVRVHTMSSVGEGGHLPGNHLLRKAHPGPGFVGSSPGSLHRPSHPSDVHLPSSDVPRVHEDAQRP